MFLIQAQVHLYDVVVCGVPTANEQEKLWIKAMSIPAKEDTNPKVNEKETTCMFCFSVPSKIKIL